MNINVVDIKNKEIEKFDINFDEDTVINRKAISQVVKWQLSKRRSGTCLLYTSPSPRDRQKSRMPSSA